MSRGERREERETTETGIETEGGRKGGGREGEGREGEGRRGEGARTKR